MFFYFFNLRESVRQVAGRFGRLIIAADSFDDAAAMIQVQISGNGGVANGKGDSTKTSGRNLHPGGARHEVRVGQVQVERLGRRVGDVRRERLGLGYALLGRHAADAPEHGRVRAL